MIFDYWFRSVTDSVEFYPGKFELFAVFFNRSHNPRRASFVPYMGTRAKIALPAILSSGKTSGGTPYSKMRPIFLPLKVSYNETACVNGDISLCTPTANDNV